MEGCLGAWRSCIWLSDVEGRVAEAGARKLRFMRTLIQKEKGRKPERLKRQSETVQREERSLQAAVAREPLTPSSALESRLPWR